MQQSSLQGQQVSLPVVFIPVVALQLQGLIKDHLAHIMLMQQPGGVNGGGVPGPGMTGNDFCQNGVADTVAPKLASGQAPNFTGSTTTR